LVDAHEPGSVPRPWSHAGNCTATCTHGLVRPVPQAGGRLAAGVESVSRDRGAGPL